ncbi:MAG: serine protease [Hyphomicrobium sp.]|nr:MAG: serine protease [Hyphomicrobium sp.]
MIGKPSSSRPAISGPVAHLAPGNVAAAVRSPRARAVALLGAGVLALSVPVSINPVFAQFKPDATARAPLSFADIVERVKPAVVSISVTGEQKVAKNQKGERGGPPGGAPGGLPDLPEDHPLNEFFKNLPKEFRGQPGTPGQPGAQKPVQGQGSGFVISADGFVVTNNHVIEGAGKIQVSFDEQNKHDADLVGTDPRTDLALLKIKGNKTFPFLKFADKPARVGDWVIAVGNPFGLGGTVTAGILSAMGRDIGSGPYDFIQIDAAVNRGNSGGPTFNLDGEVIGVNTAIYSPSGGNVGIAFAVPAKTANDVIMQLKATGAVSRGWLGVKIQNVDEDTAASIGLADPRGAFVTEVTAGGPAVAGGLKTQDAILQVNGEKIADSRDLARKIAEFAPNTTVDVKVWRNNSEQTVKVKLGTFPTSKEELAKVEQSKPAPVGQTSLTQLGLTLLPARQGGGKEGVVIAEVEPGSDAAQKGLKSGDIILEVQGQPVATPEEALSGVKKAAELGRKAVLLHVKSADNKRFVAVQLKKG